MGRRFGETADYAENMSNIHDGLRARLDTATAALAPPFAVVDLDAFDANGAAMRRLGGQLPIRLASKSLRCTALIKRALDTDGYRGILAFTLAEANWLVRAGITDDAVVGYPSADPRAITDLAGDPQLADAVTLMVDDVAQLDWIDSLAAPGTRAPLRICIDLDASWKIGGIHIGVRRSPVHRPIDAVRLAKAITARDGYRLVGMMSYEAQIAGIGQGHGPGSHAVRLVQRRSFAELRRRRALAVQAVRQVADLEFVNAGGTGSLAVTASDSAVTDLTAGSGFYGPALFDEYDTFTPTPAAAFALSVVRRPGPGVATVHGGGWVASGPAAESRLPRPWLPSGLRLNGTEGAGEVQTPLTGDEADGLSIGDRVWFRHAKAGELCERVGELHLISGEQIVDTVPTYRGEGQAFL